MKGMNQYEHIMLGHTPFNEDPGHIFVFEFDDSALERFTRQIIAAENNPSVAEVFIWVSSYGGLVHNVFAMVDLIDHCQKPVWTIALGKAMSAGCVLVSSGHKGKRCATPTSYLMFHEAHGGIEGKTQDLMQQAKDMEKLNDRMIEILAKTTGKSLKTLKKILKDGSNTDVNFDAKESKQFGLIDHVGVPKILHSQSSSQIGVAMQEIPPEMRSSVISKKIKKPRKA